MRPSEVASILGLDRTETIVAVPLLDGEFRETDTVETTIILPPAGEQRLRRVM